MRCRLWSDYRFACREAGLIRLNRPLAVLAGICLAAAALRFFRIGHESLWLDEGYTFTNIVQPAAQILTFRDVHPPLFPMLLHFWTGLFGASEAGLRSLSAVFGVLTVAVLYRLAQKLFDSRTAFWTAFLTALATFQIHYSQEARPYALLSLLSALSFLFFADIVRKSSVRTQAGFTAVTICSLYTHLFGVFTWTAQNVYYFFRWFRRPDRRVSDLTGWIVWQVVILAAYLPWLFIMIEQMRAARGNFWIPQPTLMTLVETFREFSGGTVLLTLLGISALAAVVRIRRSGEERERSTLAVLLTWIAVTLIAPLILSFIWQPIFIARYVIGASLAFTILAAKGLADTRPIWLRWIIGVILLGAFANSAFFYYSHPRNEQWRDVATQISGHAQKGDLIVIHSYKSREIFSYYFKRSDVEILPFPRPAEIAPGVTPEKSHRVNDDNLRSLEESVGNRRCVWVVISHSRDPKRRIEQAITKTHQVVFERQYLGIRLVRFVRN